MQTTSDKKTFNYGFAFLRMLMCFLVIFSHFASSQSENLFSKSLMKLASIPVPVFMFLAFYLSERIFIANNKDLIRNRIIRIAFPQIAWTFIYWFVQIALQIFFNMDFGVNIKSFVWQMFTGHSMSMNTAMWFQIDLLLLTVLYILVFHFFEAKKGIFILFIFAFATLFAQYSNINFKLFNPTRWEIRYPFGRFCEMVPYAVLGFTFAYCDILEKLKRHRIAALTSLTILMLLLLRFNIIPSAKGFGYSNNNNLLLATAITAFAYLLNFEKINDRQKVVIKIITGHTLGIYCMHLLAGKLFTIILSKFGLEINDFIFCLVIYAACWTASSLIKFIAIKIHSKYLCQLVD